MQREHALLMRAWFTRSGNGSTAHIERESQKRALGLFHRAAKSVPAYADFLQKHKLHPSRIARFADFRHVPQTTKENYVSVYDASSRSWEGKLSGANMISTSSGTTGQPHYWPRSLRHDLDGAAVHEFFLQNIFDIKHHSTLFVNGFALGNWIAGTFTFTSIALVSWKDYPLTMMTPGYDREAILRILADISPRFDQTIITGHAPFLKEIAEAIHEKRLEKRAVIKFLGTGQGITESWRSYVSSLVGGRDPLRTIINLYGSADASLMGHETPVSIAIRKAIDQQGTARDFFGSDRLPSLYQYDPRYTYFEAVDEELCVTKDSGAPLIRYNIHDKGGVLPFGHLWEKAGDRRLMQSEITFPWELPFVYLFGREKFMAKIYGANIYTEHVQQVVDHPTLQRHLTGRFLLETSYDAKQNPILIVRVETAPNHARDRKLKEQIRKAFMREVTRINSEYRFVLKTMGKKAEPKIELCEFGKTIYFPVGVVKKTS